MEAKKRKKKEEKKTQKKKEEEEEEEEFLCKLSSPVVENKTQKSGRGVLFARQSRFARALLEQRRKTLGFLVSRSKRERVEL